MNCPSCQDERLAITERQGVEIDYCPRCRGVWLDRGELDKLIERAAPAPAAVVPSYDERRRDDGRRYDDEDDDWRRRSSAQHPYPKRKKSFLSEMFDFD